MMVSSAVYTGGYPWDTYCLIVLWLWCGWQWMKHNGKISGSELFGATVPAAEPHLALDSPQRFSSEFHPT
jgi:hypothetical protein